MHTAQTNATEAVFVSMSLVSVSLSNEDLGSSHACMFPANSLIKSTMRGNVDSIFAFNCFRNARASSRPAATHFLSSQSQVTNYHLIN